jgi:hypothetical protein
MFDCPASTKTFRVPAAVAISGKQAASSTDPVAISFITAQPRLCFFKSKGLFFWGRGFHYRPSSAARPPKTTGLPLAGPDHDQTKRGVCASLPAALLPVDATHVATVPSTPAAISAKPPAVARPTGV